MAQPFDCSCGTPSCHGQINGAREMSPSQLEGYWLSGHIRELKRDQKEEQDEKDAQSPSSNKTVTADPQSPTIPPPQPQPPQQQQRPDRPNPRGSVSLDARDPTVQALQQALDHAEKVVVAARTALVSYMDVAKSAAGDVGGKGLDRSKHRGTFGEGGLPLRRNPNAK